MCRTAFAAPQNGAVVAETVGQESIASDSEKEKRTDPVSDEILHCKAELDGGEGAQAKPPAVRIPRRRSAPPTSPKPAIIIIQLAGSGTAASELSR
jgi:hypothetical protein